MDVRTVPIDDVRPNPRNAKKHPARSIEDKKASLSRFGQQKPIVVDADGQIIAGHGTWTAAKALGWAQISVTVSTLSGVEATAYGLVDNRSAESSVWDGEILAGDLVLADIGDVGFDPADLEALAAPQDARGAKRGAGGPNVAPAPKDASASGTKPKAGKPIKLTEEQREGLAEVFERFRAKHETPDGYKLSEGQIVVLIAADWLAGN